MRDAPRQRFHPLLALLAGSAGTVMLAVLWNALGLAPEATQAGYELTQYFTPITRGFVVSYAAIAFLLGWVTQSTWPVALGMILTLPIACSVEVSRDSTSHNLIPFEILLHWLPAFGLALAAAYAGRVVQLRLRRDAT